jgi:mRNA interferase RelE/StbE
MYRVQLSRKAGKFYEKVDLVTARRPNVSFGKLSENPFTHYNVKSLRGELEGSFRLRVGDIRIVYSVDDRNKIVYIEVIRFRGDV